MKIHKRFLGSGEAYQACGSEIVVGQGPAAMADRWTVVTCERCLRFRARRTDREETVAPATGLLAEGLVHGVGVRRMTSDWTASPNRDTTIPTGSVCRRARWSRGSGGQVRALTYVCVPPVRYPKHRGHTTAGAMDAAAGVDAHDVPTPACETARRAVSHKRPQPVSFLLITPLKNPEAVPTLRHASRLLHFRVTVNTGGNIGFFRLKKDDLSAL